jgi:hypothetical protein
VKQVADSAALSNHSAVADAAVGPVTKAESFSQSHRWPLLCCLLAGLALSFTPIVIARLRTGMWALLQLEIEYYLQVAGQAYYNHLSYISDPSVPDGVSFYNWLPFVPPVYIARALGLNLFSVGPIWMLFGGVGTSAGLYFVLWRFLGRPWMAAGLSIFCLSSLSFSASSALNYQFNAILSGLLLHPHGNLDLSPFPIWEWRRVVDPALDLPFLFVQILAVSIARERQRGINVWLSGLAFGLLFYVYFYMWTLAAAALCIAMLLDPTRRKIYGQTLLIGFAIGSPELVHLFRLRAMASSEALTRFAAFSAAAPSHLPGRLPWFSLIAVAVVGLWIWTTKRLELTYLWSLPAAAILLGCSPLFTGVFLHAYHWTWLMLPIRMILALIMIATLAKERIRWLPAFNWAWPILLAIYFIGGLYLAAILLTPGAGTGQLENYTKYRLQRLVPGVNPLDSNSVIAGDDRFTVLATIGENQRALSGTFLNASMALDDATWRSRFALNAFLDGTTDRAEFKRKASRELESGLWNAAKITPELLAPFMRIYDEIVRDPDRFISAFSVRYVALPVDRPPPVYLRNGWTLLQPGPYWQLWERKD